MSASVTAVASSATLSARSMTATSTASRPAAWWSVTIARQLVGRDEVVGEHRPVGQHAVARAQPAGRGERGELVAALVHAGLDLAVERTPGRVHAGAMRERLREVRQAAEGRAVVLVHLGHGAGGLVLGDGLDERHGRSIHPHGLLAHRMIDSRLRSVALLVAACFFMEILDGTIVVTAIPQMSASLGVSASATALVITAYLLTLAVLIPLSGWMSVRFGPRPVFLSAITIFSWRRWAAR